MEVIGDLDKSIHGGCRARLIDWLMEAGRLSLKLCKIPQS